MDGELSNEVVEDRTSEGIGVCTLCRIYLVVVFQVEVEVVVDQIRDTIAEILVILEIHNLLKSREVI